MTFKPELGMSPKNTGSLNVIGPHKLTGSGIIRKCGLVGVDMVLLEKVCHCGGRL